MTISSPHLSHPKYRPDIDGLRAVAVLAVVAFHAFPVWMKGGFIGVDVFFVISGYLISTIIFDSLDKKTFSFSGFYSRRIRRIFPALLLVLIVVYVSGWFLLLADEYKQLGKNIAAGAGFFSNFILWNESGYFDNSADTKPLLHLWSLGIEEQFYIVWPLVLWFAWRRKFNLLTLTMVVVIVSFILNIKGIKQDSVATFYSPQTRFWELLSGSILAWFTLYKKNSYADLKSKIDGFLTKILYREDIEADGSALSNVLSLLGSLLLVYGFLEINKTVSFPGKWAVVPVLGTVLIIIAGQKAWINRMILSSKIAVWFGLISFTIYLWHWPLLSFARIVEGEVPSRNIRIAAVVISIVLAWVTYRLVERPMRLGKSGKIKVTALVVLMAVIGYFGCNTYSRDGLPFRPVNKEFISYSNSIKVSDRKKECFEIPYAYKKDGDWFCNLGSEDFPVRYFAYGDSHALSLLPALEKFAVDNKLRIQFTATSGCPSVLGIQSMRGDAEIEKYNCKELNERVFNYVKISGIKEVVLASRWTYYAESLSRPAEFNPIARDESSLIDKASSTRDLAWAMKNTVARYSSIGVKVIFIEDNPQQTYNPKDIIRKARTNNDEYLRLSIGADEHKKNQKFVNQSLRSTGAKTINFDDVLCAGGVCQLVSNSKFLYSDDDHLSVDGSIFISQTFSEQIKR